MPEDNQPQGGNQPNEHDSVNTQPNQEPKGGGPQPTAEGGGSNTVLIILLILIVLIIGFLLFSGDSAQNTGPDQTPTTTEQTTETEPTDMQDSEDESGTSTGVEATTSGSVEVNPQ